MITRDNLKFCFESLNEEEVDVLMNDNGDFVLFELHVFNAGGYATAVRMDYDEETEQEAHDNGQIFCDMDDFLRLYEESGANNEFFNKYAY